MRVDEGEYVVVERIRADAQIRRLHVGFFSQLITALGNGPVRRAVADDSDLGILIRVHNRRRGMGARGLELASQAVHVVHVIVRSLAVLRLVVVAGAPREERRHVIARHRAVRNAVTVNIPISAPFAQFLEHVGGKPLTPIDRLRRILEPLRHPVVHAQVEVHHHEDRRLEPFREIERFHRQLVGLLHRVRNQENVFRVAMREERGADQIPLRGARRQAGGRPHTLDVEDHSRRFRVVGQTGKLGHQRDTGTRGGGHGARTGPSCADHHAQRRDFIFSLHYRERRLAGFLVDAIFPHVTDQRLAQRGRRRNRIPGHHRDAGHHAADRSGRVAFDQDFTHRRVHLFDPERILLGKIRFRVLPAGLERGGVQHHGLGLFAELPAERLLHERHVDAKQPRHDAVVNHVADETTQFGVGTHGRYNLVEGHGIEGEVRAQRVQLQRFVVDHRGAGIQRQHVFLGRLRIHRDEEIHFLLAANVSALAGSNRVPGGQAGDVRREHVLPGYRHAHQKDGPEQDEVGGLASRSVDGGDLDAEIVDDRCA